MDTNPMRKKRKICIITGSRADYGHLRYLIKGLKQDSSVKLQLIVTGMHLSSRYGKTYKVIEGDGFTVDKKINILRYSDSDQLPNGRRVLAPFGDLQRQRHGLGFVSPDHEE